MARANKVTKELAITALACAVGAFFVGLVRGSLFETEKEIKNREDVYFLPPPAQVKIMSLGYHATAADILWAHVLVSQGLHTFEHRRFGNLTRLYDAVNELDPTWQTPYLLAEALFTFQANTTPYDEVVKVREILERGVKHRPYDAEIWLALGQYVAFVAPPSYLMDTHPEEAERWRREGVVYLQRAAELGSAWQALGGASILERSGDTSAAMRFLRDAHASTEDPDLRAEIEARMTRLASQQKAAEDALTAIEIEAYRARSQAFEEILEDRLPFLKRDEGLVLGPPPSPASCAGIGHHEPECARTWRTWADRYEQEARERARLERELR